MSGFFFSFYRVRVRLYARAGACVRVRACGCVRAGACVPLYRCACVRVCRWVRVCRLCIGRGFACAFVGCVCRWVCVRVRAATGCARWVCGCWVRARAGCIYRGLYHAGAGAIVSKINDLAGFFDSCSHARVMPCCRKTTVWKHKTTGVKHMRTRVNPM